MPILRNAAIGGAETHTAASARSDMPPGPSTTRSVSDPVDSAALLQGGKSVMIHHNGEVYRLQTTRQGKLILTK